MTELGQKLTPIDGDSSKSLYKIGDQVKVTETQWLHLNHVGLISQCVWYAGAQEWAYFVAGCGRYFSAWQLMRDGPSSIANSDAKMDEFSQEVDKWVNKATHPFSLIGVNQTVLRHWERNSKAGWVQKEY